MIKILPVVLILLLITGGLFWWRSSSTKVSLETPQPQEEVENQPLEVPKTLPPTTVEERIKALEDSLNQIVDKLNASSKQETTNLDSRLSGVEAGLTELKARVSSLETASPAPVQTTTSKSTVYIPLGGGGSWTDQNWYSLSEYEISLNPDNYPGYTGMYLEVNFRLGEAAGTGYVRLFNVSDNSATSSEVSTTSTNFSVQTSSSFKLPAGTKTYKLQVKSSQGRQLFIQSARIKVNF